jgi:hypothetical protein
VEAAIVPSDEKSPSAIRAPEAAPNILISDEGAWTGNVDFGDFAVVDRCADLRSPRRLRWGDA